MTKTASFFGDDLDLPKAYVGDRVSIRVTGKVNNIGRESLDITIEALEGKTNVDSIRDAAKLAGIDDEPVFRSRTEPYPG